MTKESLELSGSVEGATEFEEETSCALERGLEKNPELVGELAEMIGADKLKKFMSIALDHDKKFVPSEEMKTVYVQVAKREVERILDEDEEDEDLTCDHSVDEHIKALRELIDEMKPTIH